MGNIIVNELLIEKTVVVVVVVKRYKHFFLSNDVVSSHTLLSKLCNELVKRKLMLVNTYISPRTGRRGRFSCPAKVNSIFKWQHRHDVIIAKVILMIKNTIELNL